MRRLIMLVAVAAGMLMNASAVEAGWGRHCGDYGGWGGGCGYSPGWCGGGLSLSVGYCGPAYDCGYGGYYGYRGFGYRGYNYGYPIGLVFYGARYTPSANYLDYYLDTSYEPAELAYGPLAAKQFLGLDRNFALAPLREPPARVPLIGEGAIARKMKRSSEKPLVRVSNPTSRRKAERYVAEGDALFRVQKFHSALQKYKLAASAAPDVAENWWRQGHALVATHNFDLATAAFKRAIAIDPDLGRDGFTLDDLYGTAGMAKTAHVEELAGRVLENEHAADAYFLLGVFLAYDGQFDAAQPIFARGAELAGSSGTHLAAFLTPAAAPATAIADDKPAADSPALPVSAGTEI